MADHDALAAELLNRRTAAAIKALRRLMDKDTAKAVINHPDVSPLDRAAIGLALAFGGADRWGRRDSQIFHLTELENPTHGDRESGRSGTAEGPGQRAADGDTDE